ncbi:ABC transporter ATP-binding protein [Sphingomonas jatrophae]|uniref:ABC transporter ATP-binding protein n=1 Tax=Sphingomonas jatrophae TaxID=1166337 RepID=UPI000B823E55|nr:sn-glycerol-3-phosphate ABC transporter ATP-binding protein UgpC [Sphingomonas jatrophae]
MATVSLSGVGKAFGPATILHDVSIEVAHGEFVALVGPSGSGKSTLLRMIAGLEEVTSGEIRIDGRVVNDVPAKARDVAMVFQNYALYPHMTVAQNLGFALRMRRLPRAEIGRRVGEVARSLNLEELLDRYPRQLSGGERQRVATGRAIVRQPQVFLFDEPLSNLDAALRVHVRAELRALHRKVGVASIYVTHDQVEAMTMADRIVVLRGGRIEQIGAPLDLYDRPASIFVATFIGSPAMNLLSGIRTGDTLVTPDGVALPIRTDCLGKEGEPLTLGIRPEHVLLAADGVALRVEAVEQTGADTMIMARLGAAEVTVVRRERIDVAPGAHVHVQLPQEHHHYFDAEGRRLPAL